MPRPFGNRSSAPSRARLRHLRRHPIWALWLFLLTLCGCSTTPAPAQIDPPPPELAEPCSPGPDWPQGDMLLADLLDLVRQREAAAADCRARHRGLVGAWPR